MRQCKIFHLCTEEDLNAFFAREGNIIIEEFRMSERPSSYSAPVSRRLVDLDFPQGDHELVIGWVVIIYRRN